MANDTRRPSLVAFIIIGVGMVVVGLSTDVMGLTGGGIVFIIIGVASVLASRQDDTSEPDTEHRDTGDDTSDRRDDGEGVGREG